MPHRSNAFSSRFGDALAERGVTLKELHARLIDAGESVSMATLSYWRSGGRTPAGPRSLGLVEAIERQLRIPAGELREAALRPAAPVTGSDHRVDLSNDELERLVIDTTGLLGVEEPDRRRSLWVHSLVDVAADRRSARFSRREMHQAVGETALSFAYIHMVPDPSQPQPQVRELFGVRLAQAVEHPSGMAFGYEFAYDPPLEVGENALIEYAIEAPLTRPIAVAGTTSRLRELMLHVRFHPDGIPDHVETFEGDPLAVLARDVRGDHRSSGLVLRRDFGPGVVGVRWDDPSPEAS